MTSTLTTARERLAERMAEQQAHYSHALQEMRYGVNDALHNATTGNRAELHMIDALLEVLEKRATEEER